MRAHAACAMWCGLATLVCGCASKPRLDEVRAPALQLFDRLPPHGFVRAADVYEPSESVRTYVVLDEDGRETGQVTVKRHATERLGAAFSDDEGAAESELWRFDDEGNIVMVAHVDELEKTITHFRPRLILMPPELNANDAFTSETSMRVVDLNNPLKVREQGQARRGIAYVGDQRLRTARGEFTAQRLEIKFIADMRMADAEERTILFIVPGEGVIARQTEVTVKILGALSNTKRRTLVRME